MTTGLSPVAYVSLPSPYRRNHETVGDEVPPDPRNRTEENERLYGCSAS